MASSEDFRTLLYQEIEAQFDGDYNVLIEALAEMNSGSSTVGSQMITALGSETVFNNALHAFKELEGESDKYYPQIFIPSYEELKAKHETGELPDLFSTTHTPTIVIHVEDQDNQLVTGYQLDSETGELVALANLIDEEYSTQNEVWAISVNEKIL